MWALGITLYQLATSQQDVFASEQDRKQGKFTVFPIIQTGTQEQNDFLRTLLGTLLQTDPAERVVGVANVVEENELKGEGKVVEFNSLSRESVLSGSREIYTDFEQVQTGFYLCNKRAFVLSAKKPLQVEDCFLMMPKYMENIQYEGGESKTERIYASKTVSL